MSIALSALSLREPKSLAHALEMMTAEPLVPLAGCTDLYVAMQHAPSGPAFLNLWGLDELRGITATEAGGLRVGALVTHAELASSGDVRDRLPMLAAAAREVGSAQIQNRGTLAGNIANGSPAGDTLPVLAAAEAIVILRSVAGERRVAFGELYAGYRRTVIGPDELIVAIEIPAVEGRQWFRKVGTRAAQAISKVVMAAVRAPHPRIALGSVAATPVRLPLTEDCLARGGSIAEAREVLLNEIHPIDDVRSTGEYRRAVAANLLVQWWSETE